MRLNDTTGVLMQVTSDAWSVSGKRAQAAALVILQRGTSTESVRLFSPEFRISCIISLANVFKLKWFNNSLAPVVQPTSRYALLFRRSLWYRGRCLPRIVEQYDGVTTIEFRAQRKQNRVANERERPEGSREKFGIYSKSPGERGKDFHRIYRVPLMQVIGSKLVAEVAVRTAITNADNAVNRHPIWSYLSIRIVDS